MYVHIMEQNYKGEWNEDIMSGREKGDVKIGDIVTFHVSYGSFQDYVVKEIKNNEAYAYEEGYRYRLNEKGEKL